MASVMRYLLPCFVLVMMAAAEDLLLGSTSGRLVYSEAVKLSPVPQQSWTENVYFNDEYNKPIEGIWARDMDNSAARATVTAGGVGFTFVNVRLQSNMGEGLNYRVQLYGSASPSSSTSLSVDLYKIIVAVFIMAIEPYKFFV